MTNEDKEEIRTIIREELNARFGFVLAAGALPYGVSCSHEWYLDTSLIVSQMRCRKCGAMQNTYGGQNYPSFSAVGV